MRTGDLNVKIGVGHTDHCSDGKCMLEKWFSKKVTL